MSCTKCNQRSCNCVVSNTTINSDQAGREGLSAKATVIKTGRLPVNATDDQFAEYVKGKKGDPGSNGKQVWKKTDW